MLEEKIQPNFNVTAGGSPLLIFLGIRDIRVDAEHKRDRRIAEKKRTLYGNDPRAIPVRNIEPLKSIERFLPREGSGLLAATALRESGLGCLSANVWGCAVKVRSLDRRCARQKIGKGRKIIVKTALDRILKQP